MTVLDASTTDLAKALTLFVTLTPHTLKQPIVQIPIKTATINNPCGPFLNSQKYNEVDSRCSYFPGNPTHMLLKDPVGLHLMAHKIGKKIE